MERTLNELLTDINIKDIKGPAETRVSSLCWDSRDVKKGSLFFALPGIHTDGHNYIEKAVKSGAAAVVYQKGEQSENGKTCFIRVEDSRLAMSALSAAFFSYPASELNIIGVTGTDGKSTTVWLIHQLLSLLVIKAGFLSTVQFHDGQTLTKNSLRQSTPEAPLIHEKLRIMKNNGCSLAVIESTSHGLSRKTGRLADIAYDVAVMTNITHEHMEFHGTPEQYRHDKANLYRQLRNNQSWAIINNTDDNASYIREAAGSHNILTYSVNRETKSDWTAFDIKSEKRGCSFKMDCPGTDSEIEWFLPLPGTFNIENTMAAVQAVHKSTGISIKKVMKQIENLQSLKGRMVSVREGQPFEAIVDYAHTPASFERVFPQFRDRTKGRLIAVFGSAGERDLEKRPIQGEIADTFSDIIILTDEDPRQENSLSIMEDIVMGINRKIRNETLFLINDRTEAIKKALQIAEKDDLVVCLGKGHEGSIIYADGSREWDEEETLKNLLNKLNQKNE